MNPILTKRYLFFTSARVILDDELFLRLIREGTYSYLIGISRNVLDVPSTVTIKHKKTINIYLDGSLDTILSRFSDTARNEVHRTMRMPAFSFQHARYADDRTERDRGFEEIYALYKVFRKAKNLELRPRAFLETTVRFTAYYNNEPISVVTVYDAMPYLRVQNIFSKLDHSDRDIRHLTGYATRRLIYEICKYGSEGGYTLLDMASANFIDPAKAGITQFKSGFGGRVEDEYIYTWRSPLVRTLLGSLRFLKK